MAPTPVAYLRFLRSHLNNGMYSFLWIVGWRRRRSRAIYCVIKLFVYKFKPIERLSNTSVKTLQLGFEEYTLSNQWTEDDVVPLLDMTENVFYKSCGSMEVVSDRRRSSWWARNRLGKSWNGAAFKP